MRKTLVVLLIVSLFFGLVGAASANPTGTLKDKVQQAQQTDGDAIEDEIDKIGTSIVEFVRDIFGIIAVVFLIWAGFVFWFAGGDPQARVRAAKLAGGFLICLVVVYTAETIVGGILGLLGYKS